MTDKARVQQLIDREERYPGELQALRDEIERLRTDLARAHWEAREQQRVNSEFQTALEVYASTSHWDGRTWCGEHNGWVLAQRTLAVGEGSAGYV